MTDGKSPATPATGADPDGAPSRVSEWSTIAIEVDGPVATVRFNRPAQRNGVTVTMVNEMYAALRAISTDDSVSLIVLTGAGSTFCPGADLSRPSGPESASIGLPDPIVYQSVTLLREMPQVTLAAINGACAGAGFAWAAACDLRLAAAGARFATSFLEVGLAGELGAAWTLSRSVGGAVARDLMFLPRKFSAEEAHRIGFVSRVFADDTFTDEVSALVDELASRDPEALRMMKANFVDADRLSLREYVEVESGRQLSFFTGPAREETMRRLMNQRSRLGRHGTR